MCGGLKLTAGQPAGVGSRPTSLVVADLNGDGKPDLAVANLNGTTVSVLLNKGDGTFAARVDYPTGAQPFSVAAADLNGDGKPDLAVANAGIGNGRVSVLLNNGDGTFAAKVDYATGAEPRVGRGGGPERRRQARPRRRDWTDQTP